MAHLLVDHPIKFFKTLAQLWVYDQYQKLMDGQMDGQGDDNIPLWWDITRFTTVLYLRCTFYATSKNNPHILKKSASTRLGVYAHVDARDLLHAMTGNALLVYFIPTSCNWYLLKHTLLNSCMIYRNVKYKAFLY